MRFLLDLLAETKNRPLEFLRFHSLESFGVLIFHCMRLHTFDLL